MVIKNGNVFLENEGFKRADILVKDNVIQAIDEKPLEDDEVIDASGFYVIPGLCDIHTHGAVGFDFSDGNEEGLRRIASYERSVGVTSFLPTTMTIKKEDLIKAFAVGARVMKDEESIKGFHMEGPYISPEKKGAQKEEDIVPASRDFFDDCNEAARGNILEITMAPEMKGSMEFIEGYADKTKISLGHTTCDYDTALEAMKKGANHVTHLYNAMPAFLHRQPALIGAAYDNKDTVVELICDGAHIHESVIRATFEMFKGRVALISDSMRATGLGNGKYTLGGQEVFVESNVARLKDGNIAASVTNLFDCMKHVIEIGISIEEAINSATIIPARSVGIDDRVGSIEAGKAADILVVDKDFNLKRVI